MASVSREVDQQHKSLLINLCEMMNPDDPTYKNFILYLQSYIPKGRLLSVQKNPIDVFNLMEEKGILKVGEYRALEEALNVSGYIDILNALKDGEKSIAARQMRRCSYRDGLMAGGSSNIETATISSVEPEESQKNISSPKVLNRNVTFKIKDARFCNIITGDNSHNVINTGSQKEVLDAGLPFTKAESNLLEDAIIKLRDDLITAYKEDRYVPVSAILEENRRSIEDVYVDLVVEENQDCENTEEESKHVFTKWKDDQSSSKEVMKITSYKQIFLDGRGSDLRIIHLRGEGGFGKTTFCRKVLHSWCNAHERKKAVAKDGSFQDEDVLEMFSLLFFITLRKVPIEGNLIDLICVQLPFVKLHASILQTFLKDHGDKVLFILDGLDELTGEEKFIRSTITRKVYPKCCFLVSSRPWKISQMKLHKGSEIDLLLDLKGFSHTNALKYAEKVFKYCYKDGNAIKQFIEAIEYNNLAKQLIQVPLLNLFLAHVWYKNQRSLPGKLSELYISFLNQMVDRTEEKYKRDPKRYRQVKFPQSVTLLPFPSKISESSLVKKFGEEFLLSLCEVAHHFLLSSKNGNSLVFEETQLLNTLGSRGKEKLAIALDLGILSVTDSVSFDVTNNSVSFLHKTVQEFFTAIYLSFNQDELSAFIRSMAEFDFVKQNENVIVFLVGLKPELGNTMLGKLTAACTDKRDEDFLKRPQHISEIYNRCEKELQGTNYRQFFPLMSTTRDSNHPEGRMRPFSMAQEPNHLCYLL